MNRTGLYAGCAWLAVASVTALGTYVGVAIAGPSSFPVAALYLIVVGLALVMATALWTRRGGRTIAIVSFALGLILAALPLVTWSGPESLGVALFGVAVCLTSAYALSGYPRPES
jgi:hypothetical protein